ncbi:nucleotidyltransferase domain-containing protein [Nonomuraea sp. NPDC048916]|uniref:DNA polymerase beta superfamily protein n=1 Tax=Nonomuraea sp. NPDC048916 TaxID=3154232 RepID=UPI0033C39299
MNPPTRLPTRLPAGLPAGLPAWLPAWLPEIPGEQPHPLVFATVSGAHLYGFPSDDSDALHLPGAGDGHTPHAHR